MLILLSGFFSSSETALMSLNRYRLRHLADSGNRGARRASRLLERPDRLIGIILLGNNFVNILASAIATVIALRLLGEAGIAVATGLLTLTILIFAEVAPKTMAALHPERVAFPATLVLKPLLRLLYPFVWAVNLVSNALLRLFGVSAERISGHHLSTDELRSVVNEAGGLIPQKHQEMLLSILDLEKVTVEDIMIPRNDIQGINIEDDWESLVKQLATAQHSRLPVWRGDIDNIIGILQLRKALRLFTHGEACKEELVRVMREPYFIPEGTPLNTQLLNFQRNKRRLGLVVDEYGDILGLATLEDILEEIVGEFTTEPLTAIKEIQPQEDGTWLVDGSVAIRDLNRALDLQLPTDGPKTLNGLVLEQLETIPDAGTSVLIHGYPVEIVQAASHAVKVARIAPRHTS